MNSRLKIFLNFQVLLLLCVSCSVVKGPTTGRTQTSDPALMDRSWLTGFPCSVPCWYGLEPGKSTWEDAIAKTEELSFIVSPPEKSISQYWDSVDTQYREEIVLDYKCKFPPNTYCIYQTFRKSYLYQNIIYPNYELSFNEAVEKLGTPDGFIASRTSTDAKGCDIALLWKERQVFIYYDEGRNSNISGNDLCDRIKKNNNKIPVDLPVQSIHIVNEELIKNMISQSYFTLWNGLLKEK